MHNGQIGGYERLRRGLEALIPDAYYDQRLGTTDSEILFCLLLAQGLETDPLGALSRSLQQVREAMEAAGVTAPLRYTAALSDGRRIFAVRYASDFRPPSLYWRGEGAGVTIVSEPLEPDSRAWNPLPPNQVLVVGQDLQACFAPLFPQAQAAE